MAKSLFDKTYIGKMKLKNRIFMSPMGTTGEADGAYCNEGIDYFEERAKGGAGLILQVLTLFRQNMNQDHVQNFLISIM